MLLRSPSATTTGHPLRVHAGIPAENKRVSVLSFTAVNTLILKEMSKRMKAHKRHKTLDAHMSLRLTLGEAGRFAELADAAGLTVSEWSRQTLLAALDCPPWARLMLGEFLALRSVVVDLQRDLMQGVNPSTERVKAILDVAETRKFAQADGRLAMLRIAKEKAPK